MLDVWRVVRSVVSMADESVAMWVDLKGVRSVVVMAADLVEPLVEW